MPEGKSTMNCDFEPSPIVTSMVEPGDNSCGASSAAAGEIPVDNIARNTPQRTHVQVMFLL
jgi:hypothetical protein